MRFRQIFRIAQHVAATAIFASNLLSQTGSGADNQIFTVPVGWSRSDLPSITRLTPDSALNNRVVLFLAGRPLAANGDFAAAFEQDTQALQKGMRIMSSGQRQARRTSNGIEVMATTVELRAADGSASYRYYVAARPPGRIEMAVYMAVSIDLYKRYWPDVERLLSSWSFVNMSGSSTAPRSLPAAPGTERSAVPITPSGAAMTLPPTSGRFEGIYSGFKHSSGSLVSDHYTFFTNGTVCHCLPNRGLVGYDVEKDSKTTPAFFGTYQLDGNKIHLIVAGTYNVTGLRDGELLTVGGVVYSFRADPARSASRALDGVFWREGALAGSDLARWYIRFTRDGRFEDNGIVGATANLEIVNGSPRFERPAGTGTYTLERYTLILRYSDGYVRQMPITVKPSELSKPVMSQIYINSYSLLRK